MNDLEFCRTLLADPNAQSDEIADAISKDPSKKQYVEDIHDLNAKIEAAAKVEVPDDLASKLIMRQTIQNDAATAQHSSPVKAEAANDNRFWQIAAAACFAFVIGLTINVNSILPGEGKGAGEYALQYTYKDLQEVSQVDETIPLDQVNAQLVSYGVQMEQDIGEVYYADSYFCNYNQVKVMRLVVAGETGNINLYILPKDNKLEDWNEFSDSRYNGKATRYSQADMVIIGEKQEPLNAFQSKVENSMKWSI